MRMNLQILPSLLAADIGHLADELRRAEASQADAIHLDIMDPTFVPNMSFGPSIVDFCRRTCPGFYRNVHLMMNRPDLYIDAFAKAGSQTLQIHVEADCDLHAELARIRETDKTPGNKLTRDGVHMAFPGDCMMAWGVLRAMGVDESRKDEILAAWRDMPGAYRVQVDLTANEYERLKASGKRAVDIIRSAIEQK